jgi:putative peptide zinc metalloprotease protein
MNDKAKPELELLIRRSPGSMPGSSGSFITKRYVANQVALTVRPKRIGDECFEVQAQSRNDSKTAYVIRHLESDKYLFLNDEEYFLWQKMDGMHTLRDVATAYFMKFGSFDFSKIQRFLERARQDKLIIIPETDLMRRSLYDATAPTSWFGRLQARLFAIDWRMSNVDDRIDALYRKIAFLFSRPARMLYVVLFIGGCAALFDHFSLNIPSVEWLYRLMLSPLLLLLVIGTFVVHELAHALACKHFGREVKAFGFAFLNRMIPSVYADVTDIWMATRSARIAVSFAGPASGMLIASIAAIAARFLPLPMASQFLWTYALVIMVASASSLYPFLFLESDGYHMLSDWLRMPALREHGRRLLRQRLRQRLVPRAKGKEKRKRPLTSDERIYYAYVIASISSILAIVTATITVIASQI